MYLLTGCLCGEDPAARSRPPCRAEGFQAESRVAGADGTRSPRRYLGPRQRAAPFLFQKLVCPRSRHLAGSGKSTRFRQRRPAGMLPVAGHGPVLPRAKSPNGGWRRAVSKRKRRQAPGTRSLSSSPSRRGAPSGGTQAGFAKGKIAKRCLAKGCVKAQTLSAFERSQSAVFPQGRARPVDCTGRPISSASTRPPRRGMRTAPSRWAITEGERPVV